MNLQKTIVTSMIALLVVALSASMAAAYTIDGDLDDWGVAVNNGDWSQDATWVPNAGVQFRVEDNVDPDSESDWTGDGDSAYATGVHIEGIGPDYTIYDEARVPNGTNHYSGWAFPTGSTGTAENYDQEAMYVDEDATHLYFAVVLSCNATTYAGDLGLDITSAVSGDGYACEYGVVISDSASTYTTSRNIMEVSDWSECTDVPESSPARIVGGNIVGQATVTYKCVGDLEGLSVHDSAKNTYIIEGKIPKNVIGYTHTSTSRCTVLCGNDEILLQKVSEPPEEQVPVLTPSGIVVLIGLLGVIGISRIRKV